MTERISLAEAYNNKDVVTQIAILKDKLDSIPDADLTNVVLKTGDQVIDGEKTFNDPIVANGGVVFANNGIHVNGTLEVDGDIIQNGSAYETHAEQVFTKNDLIVTREDAIGGIAAGQLSGIRVKKYDGVSDLNLGVDAAGIMRVGDLGSEQPLATREEEASMTSGALVKWDGVNKRMIAPASDIGDDTHPVKIVDGAPVAVSEALQTSIPFATQNDNMNAANSTAVDGTAIPITKTGIAIVNINAVFGSGSATGQRIMGWKKNGSFIGWIENTAPISAADGSNMSTCVMTPVNAGDNIQVRVFQNSGVTLTVDTTVNIIVI